MRIIHSISAAAAYASQYVINRYLSYKLCRALNQYSLANMQYGVRTARTNYYYGVPNTHANMISIRGLEKYIAYKILIDNPNELYKYNSILLNQNILPYDHILLVKYWRYHHLVLHMSGSFRPAMDSAIRRFFR